MGLLIVYLLCLFLFFAFMAAVGDGLHLLCDPKGWNLQKTREANEKAAAARRVNHGKPTRIQVPLDAGVRRTFRTFLAATIVAAILISMWPLMADTVSPWLRLGWPYAGTLAAVLGLVSLVYRRSPAGRARTQLGQTFRLLRRVTSQLDAAMRREQFKANLATQRYESEYRQRQMERVSIADLSVPGCGAGRLSTLRSAGLLRLSDLVKQDSRSLQSLPGIGPATASAIMEAVDRKLQQLAATLVPAPSTENSLGAALLEANQNLSSLKSSSEAYLQLIQEFVEEYLPLVAPHLKALAFSRWARAGVSTQAVTAAETVTSRGRIPDLSAQLLVNLDNVADLLPSRLKEKVEVILRPLADSPRCTDPVDSSSHGDEKTEFESPGAEGRAGGSLLKAQEQACPEFPPAASGKSLGQVHPRVTRDKGLVTRSRLEDNLQKLNDLRAAGILTEAEFQEKLRLVTPDLAD